MIKSGIHLSVLYEDEHLLEFKVRASNGEFAGQVNVYADFDRLSEFADVLGGFPSGREDTREFEMGTFDANYAGGGVGFRFFCVDSSGHALVEVRLRSGLYSEARMSDGATFYIPIVAAGIDTFIEGLKRMAANGGDSVFLEAAA
jgi:hypothetical protein